MNVAVLTTIKVIAGTASQLIESIEAGSRHYSFPGHMESAIYLSPVDLHQVLVLSFWQGLAVLPDFESLFEQLQKHASAVQLVLVSREIFTLVKDYRVVSKTIKASHIRLLSVSVDAPQKWLKELAQIQLKQAKVLPGLIGGWLGCSLSSLSSP